MYSRARTIAERICNHVRNRYEHIDVKPEQGLFNFRCHENAIQYACDNDCSIVEVVYIDGGSPVLHYINKANGEYLETTIGWRANDVEYYKIRDISDDDMMGVSYNFNKSLDSWLYEFTTWFDRFILRIKRVV